MNRSVLRTIEILEIIAKYDEISLASIVKITGYPKTSVYDILHALEERAMIYRCTDKVCYGIGFKSYAIGRSYSRNSDLLNSARQYMKELADNMGRSVLLGKIDRRKVLYIAKYEPSKVVIVTPSIGDEDILKDSAFAKVAEVFTHHDKKICQLTKNEKDQIKKERVAVYGVHETTPFYNMASPIYNFETRMSGVLGIFGVKEANIDYAGEQERLRECAEKISEKLGYIK